MALERNLVWLADDAPWPLCWFYQPVAMLVCWATGHLPTRDMCRNPDHDYCARCNAPTPGQA